MTQSNLWRIGNDVGTVDIDDDPERDLGRTTISQVLDSIDITDDTQRDLGHVIVQNDPGISGTVSTDITGNSGDPVAITSSSALDVASASPLEVTEGTSPLTVQPESPVHVENTGAAPPFAVSFTGPTGADRLTFMVDGGVETTVEAHYQDSAGNDVVVKEYTANPQVYESVAPPSPHVRLVIRAPDTSTVNYSVYMA